MLKLLFFLGCPLDGSELVLPLLIALLAFSQGVNAASATGQVGATVVDEIVSQPPVVFLQAQPAVFSLQALPFITSSPMAIAYSSPSRLLYITAQPASGGGTFFGNSGSSKSSLSSLVDVNAAGVATFSVTGASATSGVTVQFPTGADGTPRQPTTPAGTSNQSTTPDSSSLILPTQATSNGGRLAMEVGRDPAAASSSDPLNVQISFN